MNTFFRILIFINAFVLLSCKEEKKEQPKVIYEESVAKQVTSEIEKTEPSQIKIADLPIHIEGTNFLLHPVGDVRVYESNGKLYGSSRANSVSFSISNYNRFELTGYLENIKIQHKDSVNLRLLTDKKVQIQTVTYPQAFSEKTKKQLLIYTLVDKDTNRDGILDSNDIKSLYISEIDGNNFTKLSSDYHELIDWNIIEPQNRLYFRTIEDINKNGAFDKNDSLHYHFVNLLQKEWVIEKYAPVN